MNEQLRVLILEDRPDDAVLINRELRRGGLPYSAKQVETKEDFLYELEHQHPDLILSDHALPSFSGDAALALAQERCPNVPFVFVTGSLGEERAVDVLKKGAWDYVLKDHLGTHLVPAVRRALRIAEERQDRQKAQRELRESEDRFRTLQDGVKDYAIFMLDERGRVASWSHSAEQIIGYPSEEILGKDFACFYGAAEIESGEPAAHLRVASEEGRFEQEGQRLRKGGQAFWASVIITALRDEGGGLRGFTHVTRDITEKRRAEDAVRQSNNRKQAILETALDAILGLDEQGVVQEWNRAAEHLFGYPACEAIGRRMDELIVPAGLRERYGGRLAEYLLTGAGSLLGRPIEMMVQRADGTQFPVEMALTRIPNESPPVYTAFVHDLTARKRVEEDLRKSEERYRMLVENVEDYAIYLLDAQGRVASWNAGTERLEGYRPDEIIGQHFSRFFRPEDVRSGLPESELKAAETQGIHRGEGWRLRKDGSRFWAHVVLTALRDTEGNLYGFSKVTRDMTKQKEAEEHIWQLNEGLERRVLERTAQLAAANQELEAFSYSVSHDLRAPLRHIMGFAEILQRNEAGHLEEESGRHLQTIVEAAGRMSRLIDDLLDFSRISTTPMRFVPVDLNQVLTRVVQDLRPDCADRQVQWAIGPLPQVSGDPSLLRQVLFNLLANALKFTRTRNPAHIQVGAVESPEEWTIAIRDNGVGFDMQYASKLFGVFQRLHGADEFEGTGIGLANVRRIIARHGGRTWGEATPGSGATFFITLPKASLPKEGGLLRGVS